MSQLHMNTETRTIFQASVETQMLAKEFAKWKPGKSSTYDDLAKVIGMTKKDPKFKGYLRTARRMARNERDIVIEPMGGDDRGKGLVCLTDSQKIELSVPIMRRIRHTAREGIRKILAADYEKLTPEEQRRQVAATSTLGVISEFIKPKSQQKIEDAVTPEQKKLSYEETLKHFQK